MNRALISWQQIGDLGELLTERCPVGSLRGGHCLQTEFRPTGGFHGAANVGA